MIERIIHFSIKNKFIVGLLVVALIGWGTYSLTRLPIDAIPDITNNQVQIISIAPSLATQEVESMITSPIEVAVANVPDVIELRSISRLGLSVVTVVFKDDVDVYWARQQLSERLKEAEEVIPAGVAKIELAPVSTGLGEIYQYRLAVQKGYEERYSLMELRSIQDWTVRRQMLGTQGVADINSYGGFVRQYEVAVNPERLRTLNLTLTEVFDALERNNENTGSAYIDKKPTAFFIRGIGLVSTLDDIGKTVIKTSATGNPVLIRDVATVQFGHATRYGALVVDTTEAVGGVVMMLKGANAHEVVDNVEVRLEDIQKSLPEGVKIEPFLNRSELVSRSIGTVSKNLIEGALIVIFILVLLLGNLRAGLIVASVIPLAMLFAISMMRWLGVSGNLMSLGAIDFGLIVDGAVIIVESVVHRITRSKTHHVGIKKLTQDQMDTEVFEASSRIRTAAAFGEIIILIVYLPILALTGIEGKMFVPMGQVVSFAILGAFILSLTWVPMISALFLCKKTESKPNFSDKLMHKCQQAFLPVVNWALRRKKVVVGSVVGMLILSVLIFNQLGGEFIPQLEEGDLAAGVMTLQGGSLSNTIEKVEMANKILLDNFPEVKHAVCKIGASEIPTDPTPMETGDYIITLKDKSEWTSAETREELVEKMEEKLAVLAGVKFEFQQPIQMRFNELLSGSKQDIAIKIYGDELTVLADKAHEIDELIHYVEGVEDVDVEKVTGLAQVQVSYNRDRLAQYGLSVSDVNRVLRTAFAGSQAGVVYDNDKRYGLVVRLDKEYRQSIEDVKNLSVELPNGSQVPFDALATIEVKSGPAQVSRENTQRRISIGFNVRNRDVQSVIKEVRQMIDQKIKLPSGYHISYGGQFQNLEAAKKRLAIAVPVALILIFVLLFFTFHSVKQSLLIFTAVPMSAIGGVVALWLRGMNFSISAGVGFIALFGVAVLNGIVLIAEFNRLKNDGVTDIFDRVHQGVKIRLRPVLMTAAVASLGFLPMALSTSAGAEVQKPLATVVIGGLISATLLTLIVLPVFYVLVETHSFKSLFKRKSLITMFLMVMMMSIANLTSAQEVRVFSINDAIKNAIDSNLQVKSSRLLVEEQRALKGAAIDIPKTVIDGEYGQINSYTKDNSFTVSQSFAFPTVYVNQARLANANIKSSELQMQLSQLNMATEVKQTYWYLSYLHSMLHLVENQDSIYAVFKHAAELRACSGETNRLEMISAKSMSMEVQNRLQQVQADIDIYNQKLQHLINYQGNIAIVDTALSRLQFVPIADSIALLESPIVGFDKHQVEVSRVEKQLERSRIMPEFSVGYFSQTMQGVQDVNGAPRTFGAGDRFNGIQAGISMPLWFVPYTSKSKAAAIKEQAARTNAEYSQQTLLANYRTLLSEYAKYCRSVDYYENQAVPEAELIIRQATLSFKAGVLDYTEFALNLGRAMQIKQSYLEALNGYNQTVIQLEFVMGKIY